jgi:lysophospholipase L1-like esterase
VNLNPLFSLVKDGTVIVMSMAIRRGGGRGARLGVAGLLTFAALAGTGAAHTAAAAPQALPAGCSGTSPITCRYGVSPGNYDVTVSIGGASAGRTEMWVEARRLLLPATSTAAGAVATYSFTVNVRQPEGQPTGQGGTGNPGLDIRFTGSSPQVSAVSVKPAAQPLVAYLAGDSTVCDQSAAPYTGWGQMITPSVRPGAAIANYADSGESSGSFLSNSALLPALLPKVKANDPVFIQFGHNDKQTSASAYRNNLTTMITRVRAKGGVPVLVTPPVRRQFNGNRLTPTALHVNGVGVNLPAEMRSVGAAQNVPVIDLTAKSKALVESLGPSASAQLFLRSSVDGVTDNTHFSQYGATQMGGLVLQSIREQNLPLAAHLR